MKNGLQAHKQEVDLDAISDQISELTEHYEAEHFKFLQKVEERPLMVSEETRHIVELRTLADFNYGVSIGLMIANGHSMKDAMREFENDMRIKTLYQYGYSYGMAVKVINRGIPYYEAELASLKKSPSNAAGRAEFEAAPMREAMAG